MKYAIALAAVLALAGCSHHSVTAERNGVITAKYKTSLFGSEDKYRAVAQLLSQACGGDSHGYPKLPMPQPRANVDKRQTETSIVTGDITGIVTLLGMVRDVLPYEEYTWVGICKPKCPESKPSECKP